MFFTDFFIKRPVFATAFNLLILLAGLITYFKLPLRQFPEIQASVINITTNYTGASADLMEGFVTNPIENALSGTDDLDYMTSQSSPSQSQITMYFDLGYDIDKAVADVLNKVASVRNKLPEDIDDPVIKKNDPNAWPILYLAFTDPNLSRVQINDYLIRSIQPILSTLPGVAEAKIFGSLNYVMQVELNPYLMAARNVTADDVINALNNNNVQAPTGQILNHSQLLAIAANTNIGDAYWFDQIPVKNDGAGVIRIKDIGYAKLGTPTQMMIGMVNGVNGNIMGIIPSSDANPLVVADAAQHALKELQTQLPKGMRAQVVWNNADFIAQSIKEVKRTIIEAAIFVILVIFLFLGSLRTVLIPAVTIPLSLIGVCTLMYACGFSLNTLTFLAFVLAIGMVVDDAIVVSENIHRQMELGHDRLNASLVGAREIRFAIIAMTLTLAAVYAPIVFMGGLSGALFKEFSLTLAGTVIISGIISLTLSPMMCSKILNKNENRLTMKIQQTTERISESYQNLLHKVIFYRKTIFTFFIAVLLSGAALYYYSPEELTPKEDVGGLMTIMTAPISANLNYTEKFALQADKILSQLPEADTRLMLLGRNNNVNSGLEFVRLKPWGQRDRDVNQIIATLEPELNKITGITVYPINPYRLPGASGNQEINFVLKTTADFAELSKISQRFERDAEQNPALRNVDVDLKIDKPQLSVDINRKLAADLGISMKSISNALNLAFGTPKVNPFAMQGRSYDVNPQIMPKYNNTPQTLNNLYVATTHNQLVPLTNLVKLKESVIPETLNHFQQMRAATISASAAPGYTIGQAIDALENIAKKDLPSGMEYDFSGSSRQFVQAQQSMQLLFFLAILTIFLVLSAQFESFLDPLIVLLTVPLSAVGALALLRLGGGTINIYTQIGLVTLIGLISKHGILLVEFANQRLEQDKPILYAVTEAASIRLRPILMTTAAMILGALPLTLAHGAGAEARYQIGLVIIGGMLVGTLFTLFVIPTCYLMLKKSLIKHKHG